MNILIITILQVYGINDILVIMITKMFAIILVFHLLEKNPPFGDINDYIYCRSKTDQ